MLRTVYATILDLGYRLANADITIVLQEPRLSPYIKQMRDSVAQSFGADVGRVSVKATTEEGMGFTGDRTGISAAAAVLLEELPR
jgi:2-C-methyl-D-erythritol 2,4-cyclodiphosphate synthase